MYTEVTALKERSLVVCEEKTSEADRRHGEAVFWLSVNGCDLKDEVAFFVSGVPIFIPDN